MSKAIKKPKLAKAPKAPSKGASLQAKINYLVRLEKVKKANEEKMKRYHRAIDLVKANKAKSEALDKKIAKAVAGFRK